MCTKVLVPFDSVTCAKCACVVADMSQRETYKFQHHTWSTATISTKIISIDTKVCSGCLSLTATSPDAKHPSLGMMMGAKCYISVAGKSQNVLMRQHNIFDQDVREECNCSDRGLSDALCSSQALLEVCICR